MPLFWALKELNINSFFIYARRFYASERADKKT